MCPMIDIVLINAPVDRSKKYYDSLLPFLVTINFGILSIASFLYKKGISVKIVDENSYGRKSTIEEIICSALNPQPLIVGISCISGFSYLQAKLIAEGIKKASPKVKVIVGGKDHVGLIPHKVLLECPSFDVVVCGYGEETVFELINCTKGDMDLAEVPDIAFRDFSGSVVMTKKGDESKISKTAALNYELYPNFKSFSPSIEVGRGCANTCKFCVNYSGQLYKKEVSEILTEASNVVSFYGNEEIPIYLETPSLSFSREELKEMARVRKLKGLRFPWRSECRVDYLTKDTLQLLKKAGASVLDLGLESASPEMLLRMGKTKNPIAYLENASNALSVANELGILVKLNILFYCGETYSTLNETLNFLSDNRKNISAISAYPMFLYPGINQSDNLKDQLILDGGFVINDSEWMARHIFPVNISNTLDNEHLNKLGKLFGKAFQSVHTYYTQKKFGYLSPGTSFDEFISAVNKVGIENFPCSFDSHEMSVNFTILREIIEDGCTKMKRLQHSPPGDLNTTICEPD